MLSGGESRKFKIERGTKQGDPLSPKLFNAVLQHAMGKLIEEWEGLGLGLRIDGARRLTNLRFADDVLLMASSAAELQQMLQGLASAAARVGLELHYGKTVVLNNKFARETDRRRHLQINEQHVKVLEEWITS